MDWFFLILVVAITVEGLVEYGKSVVKLATEKDKKPLVLQLSALAGGILLCLLTGADLYSALGVVFKYPGVGCLLTGIFASRGSNYVSDLIGRLRNPTRSFEIEGIPAEQLELE